jgi:hypothetical protein
MVQVSISRAGKFQSTKANVIQGFIVNTEGFIGVFHLKIQINTNTNLHRKRKDQDMIVK